MILYLGLAIAACLIASLLLYNYLTDEKLLRNQMLAFRVRRADIAALDRAVATAAERSDIIISLMTVPIRRWRRWS